MTGGPRGREGPGMEEDFGNALQPGDLAGPATLCAGRDRPGVGDGGWCGEAELRVLNSSSVETALEP